MADRRAARAAFDARGTARAGGGAWGGDDGAGWRRYDDAAGLREAGIPGGGDHDDDGATRRRGPDARFATPDPGVVDFARPDSGQEAAWRERAHWFGEWLIAVFDLPALLDCWAAHDDVAMMVYDLFVYREAALEDPGARLGFHDNITSLLRWLERSTMRNCSENDHNPLLRPCAGARRAAHYQAAQP